MMGSLGPGRVMPEGTQTPTPCVMSLRTSGSLMKAR